MVPCAHPNVQFLKTKKYRVMVHTATNFKLALITRSICHILKKHYIPLGNINTLLTKFGEGNLLLTLQSCKKHSAATLEGQGHYLFCHLKSIVLIIYVQKVSGSCIYAYYYVLKNGMKNASVCNKAHEAPNVLVTHMGTN